MEEKENLKARYGRNVLRVLVWSVDGLAKGPFRLQRFEKSKVEAWEIRSHLSYLPLQEWY